MTDISKLRELLERVESATGPYRDLDSAIWRVFGAVAYERRIGEPFVVCRIELPKGHPVSIRLERITASIDAAVALCERVLPGWLWDVTSTGTSWAMPPEDSDMHSAAKAANPALALCAAILRAKIAMLEQDAA